MALRGERFVQGSSGFVRVCPSSPERGVRGSFRHLEGEVWRGVGKGIDLVTF